jgi:NodT family efflux transporter outer membrane factor (OMF) lipoprotein
MRYRLRPLALLAATLGACTVGPDYVAPTLPEPTDLPSLSLAASTEAPTDPWWRLYDEPQLDALITEAFAANTDLKIAEANLRGAQAVLQQARSARYPATQAEVGGIYGRDPRTNQILETDGHPPFSDWTLDALMDVSYELDLFGRVRRSMEAEAANGEAVAAVRDGLAVTIAAETARAYAQICALGEAIAVAQKSVDRATRQAEITVKRHDAGGNSDFDLARTRALVAQTEAALPPLKGQRRAALYQLAALLGRTPAKAPEDILACSTPPQVAGKIPVGDGASLLARRPDIRAAERRLAAATARIGVATADLYPRVSLTGFYGGVTDKVGLLNSTNALSWGIGPSVSWSFPNQSLPRARIRQAEADGEATLAAFDSAVLHALEETAQALAVYAAERDHQATLARFLAEERRAFELARNQFAAGSVSQIDVLTTEQALITAEAAVAASDGAIAQDQIAVFRALGGGWQTRAETAKATPAE